MSSFKREMYGRTPGQGPALSWDVFEESGDALGGAAVRRQVRIRFGPDEDDPGMDLLLYLPKESGWPRPRLFGPELQRQPRRSQGSRHPSVPVVDAGFERERKQGFRSGPGQKASRWPVELILSRGYGLATIYDGDIDPDYDDGFQNGVHPLFYQQGQTRPRPDEWGSIGAWAWGLSRAFSYFGDRPGCGRKARGVVTWASTPASARRPFGRGPRTSGLPWRSPTTPGAAVALSRRCFGETLERINAAFPHWFCENFKAYNRREHELPFDQHMLIALLAPRPVYVASASKDLWADPRGEFLAAKEASPVYRLFGLEGLPADDMPEENRSVQGMIGYHIRTGSHDVTELDWRHYLDFGADRRLRQACGFQRSVARRPSRRRNMSEATIGVIGSALSARATSEGMRRSPSQGGGGRGHHEAEALPGGRRVRHSRRDHRLSTLLARDDIDAVDVCLHNNYHAPVTIAAARSRQACLLRKTDRRQLHADGAAMVEAAKRTGNMLHIQIATLYRPEVRAGRPSSTAAASDGLTMSAPRAGAGGDAPSSTGTARQAL